jgi:DNA-directed RNA polymerase subunit RPC12/RpoP
MPSQSIETNSIKCAENVGNHANIEYIDTNKNHNIVNIVGVLEGRSVCEVLNITIFRSGTGDDFKVEIHSEESEEVCKECSSKIEYNAKIPVKEQPSSVEVQYYNRDQFIGRIEHKNF